MSKDEVLQAVTTGAASIVSIAQQNQVSYTFINRKTEHK